MNIKCLFFNLYMFYQIPHKRKALEPGGSSKPESNKSSGYYSEKTDKFYAKYDKEKIKNTDANKEKKSSGYYSEKTDKFYTKYDKKKHKDYDKTKIKSSKNYNPNLEPLGDHDFDVSR